MKNISMVGGHIVLVDDEDHECLSQWNWHFCNGYAQRVCGIGGPTAKYKRFHVLMHRQIMGDIESVFYDHINGNKLDNRKANLRPCTNAQNQANQKIKTGGTSKYKGVCWHKRKQHWLATIRLDGKLYNLGAYDDEKVAATAYDRVANFFHGEFAKTNGLISIEALK